MCCPFSCVLQVCDSSVSLWLAGLQSFILSLSGVQSFIICLSGVLSFILYLAGVLSFILCLTGMQSFILCLAGVLSFILSYRSAVLCPLSCRSAALYPMSCRCAVLYPVLQVCILFPLSCRCASFSLCLTGVQSVRRRSRLEDWHGTAAGIRRHPLLRQPHAGQPLHRQQRRLQRRDEHPLLLRSLQPILLLLGWGDVGKPRE